MKPTLVCEQFYVIYACCGREVGWDSSREAQQRLPRVLYGPFWHPLYERPLLRKPNLNDRVQIAKHTYVTSQGSNNNNKRVHVSHIHM